MGVQIQVKKGYVYISYAHSYQQKLFSTGVKVESASHVSATGKVHRNQLQPMSVKDKNDTNQLKKRLKFIEHSINVLGVTEVEPDVELISELYNKEFSDKKTKIQARKSLYEYIPEYLLQKTRDKLSPRTIREYKVYLERLESEVFAGKKVSLADVGKEFAYKFSEHYHSKNLAISTFNTAVAVIKNYCKFLNELELLEDKQLKELNKILKIRTFQNDTDFSLSPEEFKLWCEFKGLSPHFRNIRDCLKAQVLLGGMRYSDFIRVTPNDYCKATQTITLYTQKTNRPLHIPVTKDAAKLIAKFIDVTKPDQSIFKAIVRNDSSYNMDLKKIAFKIYTEKNGEKTYPFREFKKVTIQTIDEDKINLIQRYRLFKSSMARRTFITTMLQNNYDWTLISKITGHTTNTSFSRYVKLSTNTKINIIEDVFNKKRVGVK